MALSSDLYPIKNLSLFLLVVLAATGALGREWTNTTGQTLQAELVELKGATGSEVAVLKVSSGRTYEVPLAQLSAADQEFARTAVVAEPESSSQPSVFKEVLKGKLVAVKEGKVGKYEMESEPKYYAFYFTANWCPPCRAFTPKLVDFYTTSEGKKKDFEVIMVSRDNDESSMEEYMTGNNMPWPAITFRSTERMKEVQKYAGRGIPCLVLVDREGKVISHSYEGENYVGPSKVMNEIVEKTKE